MTTVLAGAHHAMAKEPEEVKIEADPTSPIGLSFGNGGVVKQVRSVRVGGSWQIYVCAFAVFQFAREAIWYIIGCCYAWPYFTKVSSVV